MKRMKIILLLAALSRASCVSAAPIAAPPGQQAEVLSLEESLSLALKNTASLLSAEQDVTIAQQRVREANFLFFPQTSFSGTLSKSDLKYPQVLPPEFGSRLLYPSENENFYTVRGYLLQPIYTGGRNTSTKRMTQAALKQAGIRYEAVKREITAEVKNVFHLLMYCRESTASANRWLKDMKKAFDRLSPSGWDEIEARALIGRMETEADRTLQSLSISRLEFLKALNRELDSRVDVAGEFRVVPARMDAARATARAMELRPELKSEIYKAQMDAIAVNLALSRRSPTVYLGASYDVVGQRFPLKSNSWETSLSIHFPLAYDFWTQILQRRAEQRQGDIKRSELQDKVRLEVRQACDKLDFLEKESANRESTWIELSRRYKAASRLPISISSLRSMFALYESEKAWLESIREQLLARAALELAIGQDIPSE
ncbi:MAG: TolC family protein [bacterium]